MREGDMGTPSFQALYEELMDRSGHLPGEDVLTDWLPKARQALDPLGRYARRDSPGNGYAVKHEDLHQ